MLQDLHQLELKVGVLTNRSREFMEKELELVSEEGWGQYFHSVVCGDDVPGIDDLRVSITTRKRLDPN